MRIEPALDIKVKTAIENLTYRSTWALASIATAVINHNSDETLSPKYECWHKIDSLLDGNNV